MFKAKKFMRWAGSHPMHCATAFFVFTVILRLLANAWLGPNLLIVRPDEFRYLHLAKSIAEGGPLLIQGEPAVFQKILYPLVISPAFLLAQDPVVQIKLVGVINCFVMASMMFPLALLVKKLSTKPGVLLLALAFAAALPDFIYTASFMSEVLYWPLCIWVFYFFYIAMEEEKPQKRLLLFVLFGFTAYLSYLTKEVGAAFLIASAVILALETMRDKHRLRRNALALLMGAAGFFTPFLALKQALFPNAGNSYNGSTNDWNQLDFSSLKSLDVTAYMLYSAAILFMVAILSFYVLPVLLPLFGLRQMGIGKQRLYWFSAFSLVSTVGAIAFTVSIREPWGNPAPRFHLRLLAPIVIPFVILCLDFLFSKGNKKKKHKQGQQHILILTATLCALTVFLLWSVPAHNYWIDRSSLSASHMASFLIFLGQNKSTANKVWLSYVFFILALTVIGVVYFTLSKKKIALIILLCMMFTVSAIDNLYNYQFVSLHKQIEDISTYVQLNADKLEPDKYLSHAIRLLYSGKILRDPVKLAEAAVSVSDYLRQADDTIERQIQVAVCMKQFSYFETYVSQYLRTNYVIPRALEEDWKAGVREYKFDDSDLTVGLRMDYIVVTDDFNPFANVEVVYKRTPFLVLRNLEPAELHFSETLALAAE